MKTALQYIGKKRTKISPGNLSSLCEQKIIIDTALNLSDVIQLLNINANIAKINNLFSKEFSV